MGTRASELFSAKTLEAFSNDIELTDLQREAAKKWLAMLEKGQLKDERSNYPNFQQIILQDLLGYSLEQIEFEKGNLEFQIKNAEGANVVGIEAKGTTRDCFAYQHYEKKEQEKPILQLATYMFKNNLEYGICTNYNEFVLVTKQYGLTKQYKIKFESIKNHDEKLREFVGIFGKRLLEGTPEKLNKKTMEEDRELTKEFYDLFHQTRRMLIEEFQLNPEVLRDEAIHYTQIYLNRLIFMFFAEDHGFIYNRTFSDQISAVIKPDTLIEDSRVVCQRINTLFNHLNKGSKIPEVFGFNGGLFEEQIPAKIYFVDLRDPKFFNGIIKEVKVSKNVKLNEFAESVVKKIHNNLNPIITNLWKMNSYDFTSQLNVDILGHIFEQSITDLEEIRKQTVSRRKQEAIYYTPEYITDFICRNTIIPYLSKNGATTADELVREYVDNLKELEDKIADIKILDPSCGSGAFLIKAVDVLLDIHREIQSYKSPRGYEQIQITEYNEEQKIHDIIENSIYGVDVNEESVEITKLSLFLKLAGPNRKLIGLSKNIIARNSVIDDKDADPHALEWRKAFPTIFYDQQIKQHEKELKLKKEIVDGFDIIIGNPPYIKEYTNKKIFEDLKKSKSSFKKYYQGKMDFWYLFTCLAIDLLKDNGYHAFIATNNWNTAAGASILRNKISQETIIEKYVDFLDYKVFESADQQTMMYILRKNSGGDSFETHYSRVLDPSLSEIQIRSFLLGTSIPKGIEYYKTVVKREKDKEIHFLTPEVYSLKEKIRTGEKYYLSSKEVAQGIVMPQDMVLEDHLKELSDKSIKKSDGIFSLTEKEKDSLNLNPNELELIKPHYTTEQLHRYYGNKKNDRWLVYTNTITIKKINDYPHIKSHLDRFKDVITSDFGPYGLHRARVEDFFLEEKIIALRKTPIPAFTYTDFPCYVSETFFVIKTKKINMKYLTALLNSKLTYFWLHNEKKQGSNLQVDKGPLQSIPITKPDKEIEKEIVTHFDVIVKGIFEIENEKTTLKKRITEKFDDKILLNYDLFWNLDTSEFLKLLNEVAFLTIEEKNDWEKYFEDKKTKCKKIHQDVKTSEFKIDQLVYKLYGLNKTDIHELERNIPIKEFVY